jgi:hypothetical protein
MIVDYYDTARGRHHEVMAIHADGEVKRKGVWFHARLLQLPARPAHLDESREDQREG